MATLRAPPAAAASPSSSARRRRGARPAARRGGLLAARASGAEGEGAVGAWLDLLELVSSGGESTDPLERFASDIGKDIYMDINGWHLYLRDCRGMHKELAAGIATRFREDGYSEDAALEAASAITVKLGGGKAKASLLDMMPSFCVDDLTELARSFADELNIL